MALLNRLTALIRCTRGVATVQLALGLPAVVLPLTFALYDFGNAVYEWSSAQKAVEVGVREAITRNPVLLPVKYWFSCPAPTGVTFPEAGTVCNVAGQPLTTVHPACDFGTVICRTDGCTGGGSTYARGTGKFSASGFDAIFGAMQAAYPDLEPATVEIIYRATSLGFFGKPGGPISEVSVAVDGQTFQFLGLLPFDDITLPLDVTLPRISATMTSEDLSDNACWEQNLRTDGTSCVLPSGNQSPDAAPTALCF